MKHNFIWNLTKACPWTCSFCCVGAEYTPKGDDETKNRRISEGLELSLDDKLQVVDNLDGDWFRIDISGGEPLLFGDNREVIERLALKFGKENIAITATGKGLELVTPEWLAENVSEVGFTYDFPGETSPNRPKGYNSSNLEAIRRIKGFIPVMAQTPLTSNNSSPEIVREMYGQLTEAGVDSVLLMGYEESGRGHGKDLDLSTLGKLKVFREYKKQERIHGGPKVLLAPNMYGAVVETFVESFNIDPQGRLLSNAWSYNRDGTPYEHVIMGDLKTEKLSSIVGTNLPKAYIKQLRRNIKR